jgi:ATP-binding cassette subfamily B protein RaxB
LARALGRALSVAGVSGASFPGTRNDRPVLQAEDAECGLACLVMVGNFHGHTLDLNGLREVHPIGQRGMSVADLLDVAAGLDLSARVVRAEPEQLGQLRLPAILHWRMKHYVVLRQIAPRGLIIDDPALGRRRVSAAEAGQDFTGVAIEFARSPSFAPVIHTRPTRLSDLFGGLQGWTLSASQILLFSIFAQLGLLATPLAIQFVVDRIVMTGAAGLLPAVLAGFLGVASVTAAAGFVRGWSSIYLGNTLLYQSTSRLVRHLQNLPVSFFEARHVGDLISRVGSLRPIQTALTSGSAIALLDGVLIVIIVAFIFLYSLPLGVFALFSLALLIGILLLFQGSLRQREQEELRASAEEQTHVMETIRNIRTTQIFGREAIREAAWRNKYAEVLNRVASAGRLRLWMQLAEQLVLAGQLAGFLAIGAMSVLSPDGMTIGALAALIALQQLLAVRVTSFTREFVQFLTIKVHLDRLGDVVHARPRAEPAQPRAPLQVRSRLELANVSFRYPGANVDVLRDVSMEIPEQGFMALTGRSGAGKSTLLKIMLGLLEPTSGDVLADNMRLNMSLAPAWRLSVGAVMQDDRLFTGSILENVSFFDPAADVERAREACEKAEILPFIESLPMGFHSIVGDLGASFSGGQVQRLFLARALYRNPRLLFLDEGTANLDLDAEARIVETIAAMPITRFVIAHRPALIDRADRVYELNDGMIRQIR